MKRALAVALVALLAFGCAAKQLPAFIDVQTVPMFNGCANETEIGGAMYRDVRVRVTFVRMDPQPVRIVVHNADNLELDFPPVHPVAELRLKAGVGQHDFTILVGDRVFEKRVKIFQCEAPR